MRKTHKRTRGGAIGQLGWELGNAVFSGIKQGIKNAPKQIYSSLKSSSGTSYLTPTGSIANYAGNNIQNIIKSHNESFRRDMGNKMNSIRTTLKNKNKKPIGTKYMPYAFMESRQKIRPNFKKYNSKLIYNNKTIPNKNRVFYNNKNLPIITNMKFNNKSAKQLM